MKEIPIEDIVPELIEEKRQGKSNSEIREELRSAGYSEDDTRTILRFVDSEYLEELNSSSGLGKKNLFRIFSLGVIAIGLIIDIVLWLQGAQMGYFVAANGISILGLAIIWRQYRLFKKLNSH
jgi:hypothetical protein